ncbi:MAG: hypothetical protein KGZ49_06360 [Syntrophaceae bacterium]|nr:hypothetical protein [Syntrophaceae bacterium]
MTDEDRIRELAERFREAIQKCDRTELPLSLADYPTGSCSDASMLLGTYFKDNGIDGFILIKGKRGEGNSLETHYWLEKGDMLVDITADQFQDINEKIVITETSSAWYGTFDRFVLQEADHRMIAASDVRAHLEAVYDYVLEADK